MLHAGASPALQVSPTTAKTRFVAATNAAEEAAVATEAAAAATEAAARAKEAAVKAQAERM